MDTWGVLGGLGGGFSVATIKTFFISQLLSFRIMTKRKRPSATQKTRRTGARFRPGAPQNQNVLPY